MVHLVEDPKFMPVYLVIVTVVEYCKIHYTVTTTATNI
jgi:hypothetical protein